MAPQVVSSHGSANRTLQFSKQPDGALRQLDQAGRAIVSTLNYNLKRQQDIDTIAGPMKLRGMYMYQADAANLTECQTGSRLPVSMEGDHLALERSYLAARRQPGEKYAGKPECTFCRTRTRAGTAPA